MMIGVDALRQRRRLADDRHEVAVLVEFGEKLQTLLAGLGGVATRGRQPGGVDALDRLVRRARIAGERDRVLVVGAKQVRPILRRLLDDVGVHLERQHAVIVAVPVAVGILGAVGDRVPGRDLVGLQQPVLLGRRPEGQADVDHVRRLRAGVALVGLDRLDLVARAGVGIELVDLSGRTSP